MLKFLITADAVIEALNIQKRLTRGVEHPIKDYNQLAIDYQKFWEILQNHNIIEGYISEMSLEKIYSIIAKSINPQIAEEIESELTNMLIICPVNPNIISQALLQRITDNESIIEIEIECSTAYNVQAIITPNPQNVIGSNLPTLSVSDLLERLSLEDMLNHGDNRDISSPDSDIITPKALPPMEYPTEHPTINVGLWMQNQLDEVAQILSWQLLPLHCPSLRRFRPTAAEDLESILTAIDDVEIPAAAVRSYRNLELAGTKLRLYAITWCLPETEEDWSLLLILGVMPGYKMPLGIQLRISDLTDVLDEQVLNSGNDYLFIQIKGNIEDKFLATITSANGEVETSVVFEFSPE